MIYFQECIPSEFPIIMEKWLGYVVAPFIEIMTSYIEAVFQSEFIFGFKCAQKFLKVITFFRLFQFLLTELNLNQFSCGEVHENDVSWFHKTISKAE